MIRPVFWLGLCFLAGETLGLAITPDYSRVIVLIMCVIMLMIVWIRYDYRTFTGRRSDKIRHLSVWFLVLPVFLCIGYFRLTDAMSDAIKKDLSLESIYESCFDGKVKSVEEKENCFYLFIKTETDTLLVVVTKEDMPDGDIIPGMIVEVYGDPECFSIPTNEGMFHEWMYYHAKGVDGKVWSKSITIVRDKSRLFDHLFWRCKRHITYNCKQYLSETSAGVAISMLTGDRSALDADVKQLYQLSGISHILAISGLHISFIGSGFYSLLRRLGIHPGICVALSVSVLLLYGVFTGMAPSTIRAVIMTGLQVVAKGFGYTYDRKTAYGLAILIVLFDAPLMITQPGFLLSFGAVGCLILAEQFLPKYVKKSSGIVKWHNKILNTLIPSLAVTLGMMPLTAFYFSSVPLYGMFLNLIIIPLMSVLYPMMFVCGFFGDAFWGCLKPVYMCIEWILSLYEKLCTWSLELPGSVITCGKPAIGWLIGIYGGMFLLLWCIRRLRVAPTFKRIAAIVGCMMPLLLLLNSWTPNLRITMIDVGQGDCFLISLPSGEHILVDGGSSDVKNVGEYRLLPYLKAQGIDTLDAVFLSHLDFDHTSGVRELLEAEKSGVEIEQVIMPVLSETSDSMQAYSQFISIAPQRYFMAKSEDTLTFSDLKIQVLWPKMTDISTDSNEGSLVLFMEYQGLGVLFTGDVGMEAEDEILEALDTSKCHVLKVAHHGSKHSTSLELLQTLSPKVALISAGKDNSYGHPHKELLERLTDTGVAIYNTAQTGQVTLYKLQKNIKVVVYKDNDVYNRYRIALRLEE